MLFEVFDSKSEEKFQNLLQRARKNMVNELIRLKKVAMRNFSPALS